tara:strand:- start:399 stop:884 length:486 start_codon:yes stop_codon:yes gene_type:complete
MTRNTAIVTFFGAGLAPKAPGTFGSLAALPFVWLVHYLGVMWLLVPMTLIVTWIGTRETAKYMAATGREDPKEVVIDEVAGQWLLFAAMPLMYLPASHDILWWLIPAGFVAFRFFDILKPWPISLIDRKMKSAWGVMLDDLVAGIMGLITLGVLGHLPLWN